MSKHVGFTVPDSVHREILIYAIAKGHGGQYPASTFTHYAVAQHMKKYPLGDAERIRAEGILDEMAARPEAVQPEAVLGNPQG